MSLTEVAVKRSCFALMAALALLVAGLAALVGFPATEESTVPFRAATLEAYLPGAPPARLESVVAKPLEERARTIPEVDKIETTVRPGAVFMTVSLRDGVSPDRLRQAWQQLRARSQEAASLFPAGTSGPFLNDAWGRVSVMTLALTGPQYSQGQLQVAARAARLRLQAAPGVEQVSLHGVREEQIYVEVSPARLAAAGGTLERPASALRVTPMNVLHPVEVRARSSDVQSMQAYSDEMAALLSSGRPVRLLALSGGGANWGLWGGRPGRLERSRRSAPVRRRHRREHRSALGALRLPGVGVG